MAIDYYPEGDKPLRDDNGVKSKQKWVSAGAPGFAPQPLLTTEDGALLVGEQGEYIMTQ